MLATTHHATNTYHRAPHTPNTPRSSDRTMNSLRASNSLNRSRSARNVMARTLPILERGGSTRNFRELPADRRRGLESPASARNLHAFRRPTNRRSNSTRRFFVADQASRSSATSTSTQASSLSNQFRRITLERADSNSSMGSFQSWGNSTMCSASANNSNGYGDHSNNDSVLSILSIESTLSMAMNMRAPQQQQPVCHSEDTDLDETEGDGEDMMSLYSKDSVRVRHNQLESSNSSAGGTAMQASCRDGMSVIADDDMLSLASSECTVYSFDVSRPMSVLGPLHPQQS